MTRDIVCVHIFSDRVDIEHIGECEVNWGGQVLVNNEWKTLSDGYVPNTQEDIAKYLMEQKRGFKNEINYLENLIDIIDLELLKQVRE